MIWCLTSTWFVYLYCWFVLIELLYVLITCVWLFGGLLNADRSTVCYLSIYISCTYIFGYSCTYNLMIWLIKQLSDCELWSNDCLSWFCLISQTRCLNNYHARMWNSGESFVDERSSIPMHMYSTYSSDTDAAVVTWNIRNHRRLLACFNHLFVCHVNR